MAAAKGVRRKCTDGRRLLVNIRSRTEKSLKTFVLTGKKAVSELSCADGKRRAEYEQSVGERLDFGKPGGARVSV